MANKLKEIERKISEAVSVDCFFSITHKQTRRSSDDEVISESAVADIEFGSKGCQDDEAAISIFMKLTKLFVTQRAALVISEEDERVCAINLEISLQAGCAAK